MVWMRSTGAIFLRELAAFFYSPVAYVVIFLFLLSNGFLFWFLCLGFQGHPEQIPRVVESLFGFALFWTLLLSPLLTMRLFAEERRTGTLELLMTAPVTEAQVVLGKFFAAHAFYLLIWCTLLLFVTVMEILGNPDWGPILGIYTGLFFLGLLTNALGLFASALTRNQLVAAVLSISAMVVLLVIRLAGWLLRDAPELQRLFHYLSFSMHFSTEYTRGVVDVRYLVFYSSLAVLLLFWTVRVLEAKKWK